MSYSDAKNIFLESDKIGGTFAGGLVDNVDDTQKANSYATYLRNARLDGQNIKIRPGFNLFYGSFAGVPISVTTYLKAGQTDKLVIRENEGASNKLVTLDENGGFVSISTGANITSDNRMNFVQGGNALYCMNGVDSLGKLDGTTYSVVTTGLGTFIPLAGIIWASCSWYCGRVGFENVVYKSIANTIETLTGAGSQTITFQEPIVGFGASNMVLYIFGKNTISAIGMDDISNTSGTLTFNTRVVNVKEGAINHNSIVSAGMNTFFLTPSNKIQQLIRGQNQQGYEVIEVSHRKYAGIDKFMATLDKNQSQSFGVYLPKENLIKWHLKREGSTVNDVILVYDVVLDKFLIDEYKYFNGSCVLNGQQYSISAIEKKIYKDEFAQDDEDSPIDFEYWTKEFDFGDDSIKKVLWESVTSCFINEMAVLTQETYVDGQLVDTKVIDKDFILLAVGGIGTVGVGEAPIGEDSQPSDELQSVDIYRTRGNLNIKGKKIQWRFKCNAIGAKLLLQAIQAKIEVLPELTKDLTFVNNNTFLRDQGYVLGNEDSYFISFTN